MSAPFRILLVDDEPLQLELLHGFLGKRGFDVVTAGDGEQALAHVRVAPVDVVVTDQKMPGLSGLDLIDAVRAIHPEVAVIVLTAYGTIEDAVAAIKAGATDYLTKPVNLDELLHRLAQVRDRQRLVAENRELREALRERHRVEGILGESGVMQEVLSLVIRVAPSDATVLIRGESGTGKELIAKAIHYASRRREGPLVRVNCAALPETLLESELFGHEKGAFTGAAVARRGRFEAAQGGTLFLDEIGDVPLHLQVKLLRVLQEREIERLFRDDLYYRINVVTVTVPALRERREDIPLLLEHFLAKVARANGKTIRGLTRDARDVLLRYDYPGNVRELENLVERAVVLTRDDVIDLADLPLSVRAADREDQGAPATLPAAVEGLERRMIREALARADGVQTRAADLLGISERVLRYKLQRYGV
ncbi:MAG: sigma-54-dependent Fis family transcriptional regulator [Candidatus Rokubacteria bacterium]|nr:sigma-54-dependent Fis family transcriptional regulator [Candidatus Rokubacteria bacterium]